MQQTLLQQLKQGREYIELWPERPELVNYFAEYKAIIASRFVLKYGASLALFALIMPLLFLGVEQLKQALVYGLFIASLPVQALFLMNKKSIEKLPPALASWYKKGVNKLQQTDLSNTVEAFVINKPTFLDLAKLLKFSYQNK